MLGVAMLLQNVFRNSKLVTMVLPFIFFVPTGVAMTLVLGPVLTREPNDWIQYLFWFPNFPFTVLVVDLLDKSPLTYFTASNELAWVCLLVQTPCYFLLHLYIEAIMPDNYGISKPLCFCFSKRKVKRRDIIADRANSEAADGMIEMHQRHQSHNFRSVDDEIGELNKEPKDSDRGRP